MQDRKLIDPPGPEAGWQDHTYEREQPTWSLWQDPRDQWNVSDDNRDGACAYCPRCDSPWVQALPPHEAKCDECDAVYHVARNMGRWP